MLSNAKHLVFSGEDEMLRLRLRMTPLKKMSGLGFWSVCLT
jgi:hypothetical protein